jgi:hypothetical protein
MPGLSWLFNLLGGGILEGIYKTVVQPFLQAYLKTKDVDLEKYKQSSQNTTDLAVAVLDANVRFAETKANYALSVLQWWPFRLLLFVLISVSTVRFCLAAFDSTWWWMFGCTINGKHLFGDVCSWSFPAIRGTFGEAEKQFLLFFIIAKPVDAVVSGGMSAVSKYLSKRP